MTLRIKLNTLCYLQQVELTFNDLISLSQSYHSGNFLFAFYEANRKTTLIEAQNPTKPNLSKSSSIKEKKVDQFLHFLVDLKVQESLARNEGLITDADEIKAWFNGFELLLKELFQDTNVRLEFQYKDYSFFINDGQKRFKLTELSDGYSAIMDIVADLILKMQTQDKLNSDYFQKGIVIIDEIETHLHLELQRLILPMLTRLFPNIQFIVTTHSPFILSSLDNAIAYDLAKRVPLADLTDYSFETLAEGYFGVNSASSYLALKFNEFKKLAQQDKLSLGEQEELQRLDKEFDDLPETIAPSIKAEYLSVSLNAKNRNTL